MPKFEPARQAAHARLAAVQPGNYARTPQCAGRRSKRPRVRQPDIAAAQYSAVGLQTQTENLCWGNVELMELALQTARSVQWQSDPHVDPAFEQLRGQLSVVGLVKVPTISSGSELRSRGEDFYATLDRMGRQDPVMNDR